MRKVRNRIVRVLLIETAAPDRPGSMQRYADLIALALSTEPAIQVSRLSIAPTAAALRKYPRRLRMLVHHATIAWGAIRRLKPTDADIFHLIDGSHGYVARWLPRGRSVVTVHDVIPYLQARRRFPVASPSWSARWLIHTGLRALRHATRIMSDSAATAQDLIAAESSLVGRVTVVPLAVPPTMLPENGVALPGWSERRLQDRPYILHLGNNGFYKNRAGVVRIFERIRQLTKCRLILAGPPPDEFILSTIRERNLENEIDVVIDPDDSQIRSLYAMARLLLFPSYYEGFGWPPLEAMAWGCPVVCSRGGSLPEVVGNAALTADVDDEPELSAHCIRVLSDQTIADQLVAAGHIQVRQFSLERFRHHLLGVYRGLV